MPWLGSTLIGTPFLNIWLRSLGAKIGRGVWCETHWLPETDLITLGDGASVNRGTVLQTHLFHDRVMRLDTVHLQEGATLGPHSIVLPGSRLGTAATVGAHSLVMRGEELPGGTHWLGNPVAAWPSGSPGAQAQHRHSGGRHRSRRTGPGAGPPAGRCVGRANRGGVSGASTRWRGLLSGDEGPSHSLYTARRPVRRRAPCTDGAARTASGPQVLAEDAGSPVSLVAGQADHEELAERVAGQQGRAQAQLGQQAVQDEHRHHSPSRALRPRW